MANQVAVMVVVMVCFLVTRIRMVYAQVESVPYGPRTKSDQHRQRTLHMIYITMMQNALPCAHEKSHFFTLCNLLRTRGLVPETNDCSIEEHVTFFA